MLDKISFHKHFKRFFAHYSVLYMAISAFYSHFSILSIRISAPYLYFSFRFRHSVSAFYPDLLLQPVDKLQHVGKIDNLQQVCGIFWLCAMLTVRQHKWYYWFRGTKSTKIRWNRFCTKLSFVALYVHPIDINVSFLLPFLSCVCPRSDAETVVPI